MLWGKNTVMKWDSVDRCSALFSAGMSNVLLWWWGWEAMAEFLIVESGWLDVPCSALLMRGLMFSSQRLDRKVDRAGYHHLPYPSSLVPIRHESNVGLPWTSGAPQTGDRGAADGFTGGETTQPLERKGPWMLMSVCQRCVHSASPAVSC